MSSTLAVAVRLPTDYSTVATQLHQCYALLYVTFDDPLVCTAYCLQCSALTLSALSYTLHFCTTHILSLQCGAYTRQGGQH
jgi:hypothetical protein